MLDDQRCLSGSTDSLVAATQRPQESINRLPTLRDIYVESLRLHLMIFGPIIGALVLANIIVRWG